MYSHFNLRGLLFYYFILAQLHRKKPLASVLPVMGDTCELQTIFILSRIKIY